VENPEYAAFARRILKACARRIATGDVESLTLMAELADTVDASIRDAVIGLRARGYSWAEIGARLGVYPPGCAAAMGEPTVIAGPACADSKIVVPLACH
jgi:hypothetical protein